MCVCVGRFWMSSVCCPIYSVKCCCSTEKFGPIFDMCRKKYTIQNGDCLLKTKKLESSYNGMCCASNWNFLSCIYTHKDTHSKAVTKQFVTYHSIDCIGCVVFLRPIIQYGDRTCGWSHKRKKARCWPRTVWWLFLRIKFNFMRSEANNQKQWYECVVCGAWCVCNTNFVCMFFLWPKIPPIEWVAIFRLINFSGSN